MFAYVMNFGMQQSFKSIQHWFQPVGHSTPADLTTHGIYPRAYTSNESILLLKARRRLNSPASLTSASGSKLQEVTACQTRLRPNMHIAICPTDLERHIESPFMCTFICLFVFIDTACDV